MYSLKKELIKYFPLFSLCQANRFYSCLKRILPHYYRG